MASIQCKMCGYMVELSEGVTACECPACGSMTSFPKFTSEHTEQLHARAEHFRQMNEFDKAMDTYEAIVRETPDDAEAYWGMVLSRFGIEYVEDPVSHERVPTCHRVQYESILADSDYKSALEHADASQQAVYETEAKRIAEIQKGILAISAQEKPFDVFICYKETTEGGSRTKDSAIAQDIYYQLTNAGYKVFFSRITLEDKLGQQYEPYIFAALNSAKVMLVVGSKKEYFNAVWVKNEWSRYLALMKKDRSRLLIPCYRDMDAYDLPDELSMLQSQDMSKIGFIQDLLRGIKKVLGGDKPSGAVAPSQPQGDSGVAPLMKRIAIFLETGDFKQAREYCNRVLDKAPENAEAHLLQLLAEKQLKSEEELCTLQDDLDSLPTFKLVMKFADAPLKARLQEQVKKQQDEQRYQKPLKCLQEANQTAWKTPKEEITRYQSLAEEFGSLNGYKDSDDLRHQCEQQAEAIRKRQYDDYRHLLEGVDFLKSSSSTSAEDWQAQADLFRALSDVVPEAVEKVHQCEENAMPCRYNQALELKNKKDYSSAIQLFAALNGYRDSEQQMVLCKNEKTAAERKTKLITACFILAAFFLTLLVSIVAVITVRIKDRKQKKDEIKSRVEVACQDGNWQGMEYWGEELAKLSSKEGKAVIARSQELHKKQLNDAVKAAWQQGEWQKMETLGKELTELSQEEGQAVISRSLELRKNQLKDAVEAAYQQGDRQMIETLGKELAELSSKEGQAVISRSTELHTKQLKDAVEAACQQGDWRKMETLGKELAVLSSKEGQSIISRSKELHTKQLKDAAEAAYGQGDWLKMETLSKELAELSPKEALAVISRSKELRVKALKDAAEVACQQGDWQKMESVGKELAELSPKEAQVVISCSKELHTKQLKEAAEAAYQQGDWQRMETLGKELTMFSSVEGQTVITRSQELHKTAEREVKAGGKGLYMVVDLQSWKVRYSTMGPDLSKDTCCTTELWLRKIKPGNFMMGSPKDEMGRYHKETQHKVTLTQIYYIGVFECTQEQWKHVMGNYTSRSCNSNKQPANKVAFSELRGNDKGGQWPSGSEVDSNSFFGKLQKRTGLAFDLPTEAQWEYACRAGMTTALNSGKNITSEREHCPNLDAVGWYDSNSNYDSHPVGLKQPNAWGLYDMHGNISEWCLDWYGEYDKTNAIDPSGAPSGDARVLRGGCLDDHAQNCRSAYRIYSKPSSRFNPSFGFRVALCP